jgi:hypothetical protein
MERCESEVRNCQGDRQGHADSRTEKGQVNEKLRQRGNGHTQEKGKGKEARRKDVRKGSSGKKLPFTSLLPWGAGDCIHLIHYLTAWSLQSSST